MPDARQISPTRSAFLELRDERDLIREGYEFLDEKRMIVAQEMLRQLAAWERLRDEYLNLHAQANSGLAAAVFRHGFDGLVVYPRTRMKDWTHPLNAHRFLGVELLEPGGAEAHSGPTRRCCPPLKPRPAAAPSPRYCPRRGIWPPPRPIWSV